jgi:hypothetical protein
MDTQVACDGLLLARLGVQAPPERVGIGRKVRRIIPEVGWVTIGLGRKNGHCRAREEACIERPWFSHRR